MPEITVSVHQPNFMPWLKLLDKILASDVYIAYDTVQYTKSEYHGRQKVKQQSGPVWLSVPVVSVRGSYQAIVDARIDKNQRFRDKHLSTLRKAYGRAAHFEEVYQLVREVYDRDHDMLADLSLDLITEFCRYLDSPVRIVRASALASDGDNTDRLIQLVRAVSGTVHLTSTYGTDRQYIDWDRMCSAGIGLRAQAFEHPEYEQLWGEFEPHLSALDLLFCHGSRASEMLRERRRFDDVSANHYPATERALT